MLAAERQSDSLFQRAAQEFARGAALLGSLSPQRLRELVDLDGENPSGVDALQRAARRVSEIDPRRALHPRDRQNVSFILRNLRNAVVHAAALTTDRDLHPVFGAACELLDRLLIVGYAHTFGVELEAVQDAVMHWETGS